MPTGSASPDGATWNEGRDVLDQAVSKALHQTRRARHPLPAPDPDAPPDEILLQYVDGTLDRDAHAELERRLLASPAARRRVAPLKSAQAQAHRPAPRPPSSPHLFFFPQRQPR